MKAGGEKVWLHKKTVFWAVIAVLVGGAAVAVCLLAGPVGEDMADAVSRTYSARDTGEESAEKVIEGQPGQDEADDPSGRGEGSVSPDQGNAAEEERVTDPAVWKASLDRAVTDAIRQAQLEPIVTDADHLSCESHYILDIRTPDGRSVTDDMVDEPDVIVYVVFQQASIPKPDYERMLKWPLGISGRRYVAAITFSIEEGEAFREGSHQEAEPLWTLDEFRCELSSPFDEGTKGRIQNIFPADLVENAFKMSGSQYYIDMFTSEMLEQAIRDAGLDGDRLVADTFDIMFEVTHDEEADREGVYINKRHPQYVCLFWYGDYTVRYVCDALLRGEREGIEEKILATHYFYQMVCWRDDYPPPDAQDNGREYFLEYLAAAQELADANGMEWMRENEPCKWKILVMASEIQQEMEQEMEQDGEPAQER